MSFVFASWVPVFYFFVVGHGSRLFATFGDLEPVVLHALCTILETSTYCFLQHLGASTYHFACYLHTFGPRVSILHAICTLLEPQPVPLHVSCNILEPQPVSLHVFFATFWDFNGLLRVCLGFIRVCLGFIRVCLGIV